MRIRIFLKKLGVVVDRSSQLVVAVIKRGLRALSDIEIQAPLEVLQGDAVDFQWRIIAIVDDDLQRSRAQRAEIENALLGVDLLSMARQMDAADAAGTDQSLVPSLHFDIALKIRLRRIHGDDNALHRNTWRHGKSHNRVFIFILLRTFERAGVAPYRFLLFFYLSSSAGNICRLHR